MKAIHNSDSANSFQTTLLSVGQRYKVWKQFTTYMQEVFKFFKLLSVGQRYKVWKQFTTTTEEYGSYNPLLSVGQRYKVWKQFTTKTLGIMHSFYCYQ